MTFSCHPQKLNNTSPLEVFNRFSDRPYFVWLDGCPHGREAWHQGDGRYSYICFDPVETIVFKNGTWHSAEGPIDTPNPFNILRTYQSMFSQIHDPTLPPFQGGLVGYFSYDLLRYLENVPLPGRELISPPEMCFGVYDFVIAFDHLTQDVWLITNGYPEWDAALRATKAKARAQEIKALIENTPQDTPQDNKPFAPHVQCLETSADYLAKLHRVIEYIRAGDIFQANLTQPFCTKVEPKASAALYAHLRQCNPAPYSLYFNGPDVQVSSSSPELFLNAVDNQVHTKPIKGTRKRYPDDPMRDATAIAELQSCTKEKAENLMIVDLLRNDLSKSCKPGSVKVESLWGVETYATVHHLVSTVSGELKGDKTLVDLVEGCFPGGSITGAPKVRAMEIISELEYATRGLYCGSFGYIGFNGTLGLNILIRTLIREGSTLVFNTGGGIVVDSIPEKELTETHTKAMALVKTLCGDEHARPAAGDVAGKVEAA
jgi:para-aminobenzoate synthetase component 1